VAEVADDWGVWVNECGIFASTIGADRWVEFTIRCNPARLECLWTGPGGGEWHLMCGTKEAATEARDLFAEVGFHKAHVRVARLSACRERVAARRAAIDARMAAVAGG
jgi:hypothetical protein